jgi:hypothetical protein
MHVGGKMKFLRITILFAALCGVSPALAVTPPQYEGCITCHTAPDARSALRKNPHTSSARGSSVTPALGLLAIFLFGALLAAKSSGEELVCRDV